MNFKESNKNNTEERKNIRKGKENHLRMKKDKKERLA